MALAFFERLLRRLALGDFQTFNSRFEAASSTVRWLNVSTNFFRWTAASRALRMRFLNRGDRHGKENPRLLDERGAFAGRAIRQHFRDQDLLVELGQVQRLQPGGQRLPPRPRAGCRLAPASLLEVRRNAADNAVTIRGTCVS
jgi:hypothetical protein